MENITFDLLNFIAGVLTGGVGGALITLKLTKNMRASGNGITTDQSKAKAGGDIVGRDKKG
jgi:hypothetical protein